jgi:hypothetical protein
MRKYNSLGDVDGNYAPSTIDLKRATARIYSNTSFTNKLIYIINLHNTDDDFYLVSNSFASYIATKSYISDKEDLYKFFHPTSCNLHELNFGNDKRCVFTKQEYRDSALDLCLKARYIDKNNEPCAVFTKAQIYDLKKWFETRPDNNVIVNTDPKYLTMSAEVAENNLLKEEHYINNITSSANISFVIAVLMSAVDLPTLKLFSFAFFASLFTTFSLQNNLFPDLYSKKGDNIRLGQQIAEEMAEDMRRVDQDDRATEFWAIDDGIESLCLPLRSEIESDEIKSNEIRSEMVSEMGSDETKSNDELGYNIENPNSPNTNLLNDNLLNHTRLDEDSIGRSIENSQ